MNEFEGEPGEVTLEAARAWLREQVDEGAACPCCTQFAKVYRRKIHATMAAHLIRFERRVGREWAHYPSMFRLGGDFGKLRYWGLIEEEPARREDGGRAGYWRVTDEGEEFVLLRLAVPKYARIYDDRCLNLIGEPVTIRDALGSRFDYDELMRGE